MGSLYQQNVNGRTGWRLQFYPPGAGPSDKRVSLWLGFDELHAKTVAEHVDHMLGQIKNRKPYGKPTNNWLDHLARSNAKLHDRLSKIGFCDARVNSVPSAPPKRTLKELCDRFLPTVADRKIATQIKLEQAADCLLRYPGFGPQKPIEDITRGDAEEFRIWLSKFGNSKQGKLRKDPSGKIIQGRTSLSENTVRRRTGLVKQIFEFAIRHKWISENPFVGLVCTVTQNEERMEFVHRETIQAAIDFAPNAQWRALIALARFGGLRCNSQDLI